LSEAEKGVTGIRGLDANLYNQILVKAKEMGKNVSDLVNDALRRYLDQVLAIPVTTPEEFGVGAVGLWISKTDMEKLGKVIIRGAVDVKFEEDVDDKAIEEHIVSIINCVNVQVPQQGYLSLMKRARNCVNVRPYSEKISPASQTPQAEVGLQPAKNAEVVRIGDLEELELSKEDLETFGKRVVLENIEDLKLGPDIDIDTANRYIEIIQNVEQIEVPRAIYMLILTKQRNCQTIAKY